MTGTALVYGLVAVWASQSATPAVEPVLSLEDALRVAEERAFSLRVARSEVDAASAQVRLAESFLGPGAQVTGTTTFIDAKTSGEFGQSGSQTTTNVALQVSQIIDITGVYRNRILAARYQRDSQEAVFRAELNAIRGAVKSAYFGVLQAQELVLVRETALASASERLEKARIREQEGEIPRFDVLRLEVEVKQAELALVDARGSLQLAKQNLNNILGRPIETDYEVDGTAGLPGQPDVAEPLVKTALVRRAEVDQAKAAILALEQLRIAEGKGGLPSLQASAGFQKNIDPGFGQADEMTTASLTLNIPLVLSGSVAANTRIAKEREEQAKIRFEQLQLGIALEVQSALTELRTAYEAWESARKNEELAAEALRLAQLRYEEGVGILLDVTTSQADFTAAQASVSIAAFRVRTAYAALQRAVGTDDLSDLDELQNRLENKE